MLPTVPPRAAISVVTVAYGPSPDLKACVAACVASVGIDVEIVLLDNGGTEGIVDQIAREFPVIVVRPETNSGFAGGCNRGVAVAHNSLVAFINPDAIVEPEALEALARCLEDPTVGIATAALLLADRPTLLNSGGNDVHFLGLSWAGKFEEPWSDHQNAVDVLAASGGAMMMRRDDFQRLGGFEEMFFAYFEDADLSIRMWLSGKSVRYVPTARVLHDYSFSKGDLKYFLVDRNRMLFAVRTFPLRWWVLLGPFFLLQEVGITALAVQQGWLRQRVESVSWMLRNRSAIRSCVQQSRSQRSVAISTVVTKFAEVIDPRNAPLPALVVRAQWPMVRYWRLVSRWL